MMPLEIWILLGLFGVAILIGTIARLRRRRSSVPPDSGSNVYPLW